MGAPSGRSVTCPSCAFHFKISPEEVASKRYRCPHCGSGVDLGTEPPTVERPENFVEVFSTRNQGDIALLKSLLDDAQIDYYVLGEEFLSIYPLIQPARFFVSTGHAEKAKLILKSIDTNSFGVSRS